VTTFEANTELVGALRDATRVTVLSGAGMSAESGVPTFRGDDGLWRGFDPELLASVDGFESAPERVWDWYRWRLAHVLDARPNPGHRAIFELARHVSVRVVTQNVDGLHQAAGSDDVIELHGSIRRVRCADDRCRRGDGPMSALGTGVPLCVCGRALRPAVVWFGELLPEAALEAAALAASQCDVALVVGTSGLVAPASSLPLLSMDAGAVVAEINPEPTPLSDSVHYWEQGPAGLVLPRLLAEAFG